MKTTQTNALTLIELIIVTILIGILTVVGLVKYNDVVTRARQKDAASNLMLIKYAERIYYAASGNYYPSSGTANISSINTNLKLAINSGDVEYSCSSGYTCVACFPSCASPSWTYTMTSATNPTCSGAGCL